ncbi:MAG: phage integrase SAM-like domain-containing protein [Flavobacteriaceae bacterium]
MTKISFRVRSKDKYGSIYVYLHNSENQKIERRTGLFTPTLYWNNYRQRSECPFSGDRVNFLLDKLQAHATKSYTLSRGLGNLVDGHWLDIQIAQVFNRSLKDHEGFLVYQIDRFIELAPYRVQRFGAPMGLKENTIRNYKGLKRIILEFEEFRGGPLLLTEINESFVETFTSYMIDDRSYSINYTSNTLKFLKSICNHARKKGIKVHHFAQYISCFSQSEKDRYLQIITPDEIQKIKNVSGLTPRERTARAWMLIGLYIGQRVSDLLALTPDKIRRSKNGGVYVDIHQQKTSKFVTIGVIDPDVVFLLTEKFPKPLYAQQFNYLIKEVSRKAGIETIVKGYKLSNAPKRKIIGEYYKWELLAAHDLRRSFATNYFGKIETPLLMHITGHTKETTFLKYVGKTQSRDAYADAFMEKARFIL